MSDAVIPGEAVRVAFEMFKQAILDRHLPQMAEHTANVEVREILAAAAPAILAANRPQVGSYDCADWCCAKGCPGPGNALCADPPCDGTRCTCGHEAIRAVIAENEALKADPHGEAASGYHGITHHVPQRMLPLWRRVMCSRGWHAWDEVWRPALPAGEGSSHDLSCDACGLVVEIASIDDQYVEVQR